MGMVGCGNRNSVDIVFLFGQHFAEVAVIGCLRKFLYRSLGLAVIHIAEGYNIYPGTLRKFSNIAGTLATHPDAGNIQFITRCNKAAAQYMAGYNEETGACQCGVADKILARNTASFFPGCHVGNFHQVYIKKRDDDQLE